MDKMKSLGEENMCWVACTTRFEVVVSGWCPFSKASQQYHVTDCYQPQISFLLTGQSLTLKLANNIMPTSKVIKPCYKLWFNPLNHGWFSCLIKIKWKVSWGTNKTK